MNQPGRFEVRPQWSSFYSYIIVTLGAVVGLGNIIGFPALIAQYGGMFVLCYLLCECFISFPLLLAELMIGRRGKQNPVGSISILAMESQASTRWKGLGWLCFFILLFSLSFYTVYAAYPIVYFTHSIHLLFAEASDIANIGLNFQATQHPALIFFGFLVFLLATFSVVIFGINRGLETISQILIPFYFIFLILLAVISCGSGNLNAAWKFLFLPSHSSFLTILFAALVFAFLKLNVGMGSMIVYGSYLPYRVSLIRSTLCILLLDFVISVLAYFVIFPLALSDATFSLAEQFSYDHLFEIFAHMSHQMSHSILLAISFFLLTILIAWTPTIAMAESIVVILQERFLISRVKASVITVMSAVVIGFIIFNRSYLQDTLTYITTDILTTLSAIGISIFTGWIIDRNISQAELNLNPILFGTWRFFLRLIIPIAILLILVF